MFDFTIEALQGSPGTLVSQMCEVNCIAPVDLSFMNDPGHKEMTMREALASLNVCSGFLIINFIKEGINIEIHQLQSF